MKSEATQSDELPPSAARPDEVAGPSEWRNIEGPRSGRAFGSVLSDALDAWLTAAFAEAPTGTALAATGSFGRREIVPASDLDLVLLHEGKVDGLDRFAEAFWYPVWDSGWRVDHSVRSLKEAVSVADNNLEAALAFLDLRHIAGDQEVVSKLRSRWQDRWTTRISKRIDEVWAARAHRCRRSGEVAFLLEPDLRDGRGGLRDAQLLLAMASATPSLRELCQAVGFVAAHETLLDVRLALRRRIDRASDVLTLQEQDDVALSLELTDANELMFRVSEAARTISWSVDEGHRRLSAVIAGPVGRGGNRPCAIGPGIVLQDGELTATVSATDDPSVLLRTAAASAELSAAIAPRSLQRFIDDDFAMPDPWPHSVLQAFLALLGMGRAAIPVLETLDHHGLLVRLIPEWSFVRSLPQRNALHRFTVDRHLLETVANAATLTRNVSRPDLLLLGALFHDIGKGHPGDHTEAGVVLVDEIGRRLGLSSDDIETLVTLVRHHLLLSEVATRRDLSDPVTIESVRDAVGDIDTLELLAALTEADSIATGTSVWSDWKSKLLSELISSTIALMDTGAAPEPTAALLLAEHRSLLDERQVRVVPVDDGVLVVAPDMPGLLSIIAGTFSIHKLDVLAASADTDSGMAIDRFQVEPSFGDLPDWSAVERDLKAALDGRLPLHQRVNERYLAYAASRRNTDLLLAGPCVLFDDDSSATATRIEVRCPDSVGLLFRLAGAFTRCGVDIRSTKVATLGHEVVDTFYVVRNGKKLSNGADREALESALLGATRPG